MERLVSTLRLTPGVPHILLSTVFFALMNVGVKLLPRLPSQEVVFFRALTTLVVGYAMLRARGVRPWGNHKPLLVARGAFGTAALVLYFYTLQRIPLPVAVTLQHLSPLFTILAAAILLREPPGRGQVVGFLVALAGVGLVKGPAAAVSPGQLAVAVGGAAMAGVAYTLVRKLKDHDHPLVVVFYFPLVTVPAVGPLVAATWVTPTALEWALLLGVGLTTTAAQVYMTRAYQADRAANVSIFNYLGVVFALLFGVLLFDEAPDAAGLLGVALIVAGVGLATRLAAPPGGTP